MTAHSDRIRQAEHAAGVYDDTPWEVGDILTYPTRENLPDGTVLIDKDGDPWQRDGDWFVPDFPGGGPVPEASPRRPPGLLRPINRHDPRLLPTRQQHLHTPLPQTPPKEIPMTAHSDRIRQAEHAAGVYDDTPWEVGDILTYPTRENLPERTVLIDKDGDPWQRDGDWFIPGVSGSAHPAQLYGPYTVAWLPKEDAHE